MRKLIRDIVLVAIFMTVAGCADANPAKVIEVERSGLAGGRTIVLIPGLASGADVWGATRALLEADYDVRTVQIAGFAGAPTVEVGGSYTDAIAAAIEAELIARPGQSPVLVGHSMGGFVSLKVALAQPEMIDELVVVDSLPFLAGLLMPGVTPELAAAQAPAMAAEMAALPRETFDAQQAAGLGRLVKTQDYLSVLKTWGVNSDQKTVSKVMGEILGADLRAQLAGLETETLVMVPWDAAIGVPREVVESVYKDQYEAAPNADIQVFEDSFHFIMIDQADAFHASLIAALKD